MFNWIKKLFKKKKNTIPKTNLNLALISEYESLYRTMVIDSGKYLTVQATAKAILEPTKTPRYIKVELASGVPWEVIAIIHSMESGCDFRCQLFNGQRWNKKTTIVPKGLGPWSSWEEAAIEAMSELRKKHDFILPWDISEVCYALEDFNGWGYRKYHSHVKSPYLWSMSNHYIKGKYTFDSKWDGNAVSKQVGAICLYKELKNRALE